MKSFFRLLLSATAVHLTVLVLLFFSTVLTWNFWSGQSELNKFLDKSTLILLQPVWAVLEKEAQALHASIKFLAIMANSFIWGIVLAAIVSMLGKIRGK